jgi:hypothetical protein
LDNENRLAEMIFVLTAEPSGPSGAIGALFGIFVHWGALGNGVRWLRRTAFTRRIILRVLAFI